MGTDDTTAATTPVHVDADLTVQSSTPVSAQARDNALYLSLFGLVLIGVLSCFVWPTWESGAMMVLTVLANIASFLLGTKSALASPKGGG